MSNENSSDSTSQGPGLVGASTAGTVSEHCETVETAASTARMMVSLLEAESVLELATDTATCPAAPSFSHLMCPPAAEVAQMHIGFSTWIATPAGEKKQRAGARFRVADIVSAAHPGAGSYSAVARLYRQERKARTWDKNKLRIFAVEQMMRLRGIGTPDPIHAAKEIEKAAIAKWPELAAPKLWKNV